FSLAIADLNNDDRPDIAVADSGANPAGVQVLFQDSAQPGIFRQPLVLTSRSTREIAAADVNGDNRTDLVLNLGRSVSVLQQEPTQAGVFTLTDSQALDCDGNQMALDDLNADDSLDIVLACGERAAVLFNSRSQPGRFTSPQKVGL
ncbi:MAG TPA: VCBS repeat-containing protein, partial [Steroidobacteraceae bacterium]|nr:VCBS repeat-containing protein [Steroidobacteraceae bacterium]